MTASSFPVLSLKPREERRLRRGHRWVYAGELAASPGKLAAGATVLVEDSEGRLLGSALWRPGQPLCARLFSEEAIDYPTHLVVAIEQAHAMRERLCPGGHHRLVFGESDALPGLTVDRFGAVAVVQLNSAVAEAHAEALAAALLALPGLSGLVIRRDAGARRREGLPDQEPELIGELPAEVWAVEGNLRCAFDPFGGMKGGWFWDQRENRAWLRGVATGARVLDLFCHTGGFALQAAAGGAESALGLDRSEPALDLARRSADENGLGKRCRFQARDLMKSGKGAAGWPHGDWDIVVLDPPALAKGRGDAKAALEAYTHLNRKAVGRVAPGGLLLTCSCTFPVEEVAWTGTVLRAVRRSGRWARIVHRGGQGADHPVLPGMPETRYLKAIALQLD